jgi:hypothetical protein
MNGPSFLRNKSDEGGIEAFLKQTSSVKLMISTLRTFQQAWKKLIVKPSRRGLITIHDFHQLKDLIFLKRSLQPNGLILPMESKGYPN